MDAVEAKLTMIDNLKKIIEEMAGLPCSRKEVGRSRSLSLGLGAASANSKKRKERSYRAWEIGTYRSAWRVVSGGKVLCGSQDAVDSVGELNSALQKVELGRFVSLSMTSDLDIRIAFENDTVVDFLTATSDEDEAFHIFCPDGRVIEFSVRDGWRIGPGDQPWADIPANGRSDAVTSQVCFTDTNGKKPCQ